MSDFTCEYPKMITNTKLDPIETASRDELQALQTQRLKWTLKHAYDNVPMYRRKFDTILRIFAN